MATKSPSILEEVLPLYDISSYYSIQIKASPDRIYDVIHEGIPSGAVTRLLMGLRSVPRIFQKKKTHLLEDPFYRLKEACNREMVYGIIGQFWKPVVRPISIHSLDDFLSFHREGYCKAALNVRIEAVNSRESLLTTETRVQSFGDARIQMKRYWRVIRPFSGLIRREMLRKVKSKAELPARKGTA